jgi:hypothetical protein
MAVQKLLCLVLLDALLLRPNTVTFEQPYLFTLNIIIMVLVALPSLVLAIYDYMLCLVLLDALLLRTSKQSSIKLLK